MLYMVGRGFGKDENIINVDPYKCSEKIPRNFFHDPYEGGWRNCVSLEHDIACKTAEGCFNSVVFLIIRVHSCLKIGITEVYFAAVFCSSNTVEDDLLVWD